MSANSTMKSSAVMAQLTNALEMQFLYNAVGCSAQKLTINHMAIGVCCMGHSSNALRSWELGDTLCPLSMNRVTLGPLRFWSLVLPWQWPCPCPLSFCVHCIPAAGLEGRWPGLTSSSAHSPTHFYGVAHSDLVLKLQRWTRHGLSQSSKSSQSQIHIIP